MGEIHRSLTLTTNVSRQAQEGYREPYRTYRVDSRSLDLGTKRYIYGSITEGKTNRQIQDELKQSGVDVSLATVRNYRNAGEPENLWEDEVIRINRHGQFSESALSSYGFAPGTSWKISRAEDGTVTLKPV